MGGLMVRGPLLRLLPALLLGLALLATAVSVHPPTVGATTGAFGKISFTSFRDGDYEIYAMNDDGSGLDYLTGDPGSDAYPAWSPDGTKIAFTSGRDGDG